LRNAMSRTGREMCAERFDYRYMTDWIREIYIAVAHYNSLTPSPFRKRFKIRADTG